MSDAALPETASAGEYDDARAKRAVAILVWAQSVLGAQMSVHFILGGLTGALLAGDKALATLPISMTVLGSMLAAPALSALMGRFGRRPGFVLGALTAACGSGLAAWAIMERDFPLFCAASMVLGVYMAAQALYRFAAADVASPAFRPKAISWVMAGGLASAVLGPEIVVRFKDLLEPVPYAGGYLAMVALNIVGVVPMLFLDLPTPPRRGGGGRPGRPWPEILADRRVPVAMFCAMVSYALMNLVMTSTPLAVVACGFATDDAAQVVRIHVIAMFAPSFFTGTLIARFGAPAIIAVGLALLAGCTAVAIAGITLTHFSVALALLGLGWNFGFIGATALLASAHRLEERARVQGVNDFLVFGLVTVGSFGSVALMAESGWNAVNLSMLPVLALAAAALAWLGVGRRPRSA